MGKHSFDMRIGTSGWHYNHWVGPFYPDKLPKSRWFEYYAQNFDTVEINNTFYQLPKDSSFEKWYAQAPEGFVYTVKANRYITHIKRIKDVSDELQRFFARVVILKEKLGPILYQLPPSMQQDLERLKNFIKLLPKNREGVFEFRHKSWFSEDTFRLLNKFGLGFCVHDLAGICSPRVITGEIIYVRFHGPTGKYQGNYSKAALKDWAQWIKQHNKEARSVYVYFNNDIGANAVRNAKTLKQYLEPRAK